MVTVGKLYGGAGTVKVPGIGCVPDFKAQPPDKAQAALLLKVRTKGIVSALALSRLRRAKRSISTFFDPTIFDGVPFDVPWVILSLPVFSIITLACSVYGQRIGLTTQRNLPRRAIENIRDHTEYTHQFKYSLATMQKSHHIGFIVTFQLVIHFFIFLISASVKNSDNIFLKIPIFNNFLKDFTDSPRI
jgi:ATP/ADP translocase